MASSISKKAALAELWRRGELAFLMDSTQRQLRELFSRQEEKINVWLLARRSGKTYALLALALEQCLKNPNMIVKFLGPTKLWAKQTARPLMEQILRDCPKEVKPKLKESDYIYYFANGSELQMAGADAGHAEKLRGSDAHLVLVDEAGSINDLKYIIQSVLLPTTLMTKGKIVLASTPSVDVEHDFRYYIEEAEAKNTIIKKTIYDNPRLTKEDLEDAIKEMGGIHTEAFRREYLCEVLRSGNSTIIPEFDDALIKDVVKEWKRPPFFDGYVAMDLGFKDFTALVFGYYDFQSAKVIIEDELLIDFKQPEMNLKKLCELIKQKEESLWTNPLTNETRKPHLRVSDIDYIVLQEIYNHSHGSISFAPAIKHDREASINNLRTYLSSKNIIIHPRCTHLIQHIKNARWNKSRTEFARSAVHGHYDLLAALTYFLRSISLTKNPYPANYNMNTSDMFGRLMPRQQQVVSYETALNKIFNVRAKGSNVRRS